MKKLNWWIREIRGKKPRRLLVLKVAMIWLLEIVILLLYRIDSRLSCGIKLKNIMLILERKIYLRFKRYLCWIKKNFVCKCYWFISIYFAKKIFDKSYINTIINSNPALWTASSIDDNSKTSFTVKKIIYKYNSLVYYTMHRAKLGISDGYNTVYTTKLIATSFPYNYIYYNGSWHKLMPYIYYNGSWQPLIIYIRYAAGWRLPDGNS